MIVANEYFIRVEVGGKRGKEEYMCVPPTHPRGPFRDLELGSPIVLWFKEACSAAVTYPKLLREVSSPPDFFSVLKKVSEVKS